jgi:hypothetical protein
MARVIEDTTGKIRDMPIAAALHQILSDAGGVAGIDIVRVTSGGQAALGSGGRRTGSTRHDNGNAADLKLERANRALAFTIADDMPFFEAFIASAVRKGATGVGAGVGYMGTQTLHVGFGDAAVWGAGGKNANAPGWLKQAFQQGRSAASANSDRGLPVAPITSPAPHFVVIARSGLKLRNGPGTQFSSTAILPAGTRLTAVSDLANPEWARVDLQGDGLFDGYVFGGYIAPA